MFSSPPLCFFDHYVLAMRMTRIWMKGPARKHLPVSAISIHACVMSHVSSECKQHTRESLITKAGNPKAHAFLFKVYALQQKDSELVRMAAWLVTIKTSRHHDIKTSRHTWSWIVMSSLRILPTGMTSMSPQLE